jgi:hypothetical protein
MKTNLVPRYHPLLVTLHWLLAALIVGGCEDRQSPAGLRPGAK